MNVINKIHNLFNVYLFPIIRHLSLGRIGDAKFLTRRLLFRLLEPHKKINKKKSTIWCKKRAIIFEDYVKNIDYRLFLESKEFEEQLRSEKKEQLTNSNYTIGGGAHYPLLYFYTRKNKPTIIVETGVAAGFSSRAFLEAINLNKKGHLYSSDYPYINNLSHKYIGMMVPEYLRNNWSLFLDGDNRNLKKIKKNITEISLFHYDSDKSYIGRRNAVRSVAKLLSENSLIIMDDIQDNLFFKNFVTKNKCHARVFEFEDKYIGLISRIHLNDKF